MAIDKATKDLYNEKISVHKDQIKEWEKEVKTYQKAIQQNKKLEPFLRLGIVANYIRQANLYMDMNDLSEQMMGIKNHSYLENARKLILKIFPEMDKVVTMKMDEPIDFNREQLNKLKPFTPKHRLNLYKHLQKTIKRLIASFPENTKWKWSFPDMWANLAVMGKNIIDFREIQSIRDPREEYYYDRQELLSLVKTQLFDASGEFRNKYELSTKSNNDLIKAIRLLEDLKRICAVTGDSELAQKAKAGIEAYRNRIEASEEEKKKKKATKGKGAKKKKKK
ncbi:MAG: hypothetical protein D6767_06630 [Candidatus Hydrogenedentota bacterium]|nr:MAG: hypothetical protein D6767_06630 [Candidatus Hydrogenedentota bacterium]